MTAKRTPRKNLFGEMSRDKLSTDAAAAAVVYIEFLICYSWPRGRHDTRVGRATDPYPSVRPSVRPPCRRCYRYLIEFVTYNGRR